ncbi:hypothetical protein E1A91_A05G296100v1 [Gossypium mustelinum]|uniref:Uncharacterized protein n=1 Tax=Gossypium mustelinum TaxID=34275 RepID=A0A5D2ZBX9_GOSMU|nr:hypothetical protein E1A91_A05G296100v1 [Gossypium mustelinum]
MWQIIQGLFLLLFSKSRLKFCNLFFSNADQGVEKGEGNFLFIISSFFVPESTIQESN